MTDAEETSSSVRLATAPLLQFRDGDEDAIEQKLANENISWQTPKLRAMNKQLFEKYKRCDERNRQYQAAKRIQDKKIRMMRAILLRGETWGSRTITGKYDAVAGPNPPKKEKEIAHRSGHVAFFCLFSLAMSIILFPELMLPSIGVLGLVAYFTIPDINKDRYGLSTEGTVISGISLQERHSKEEEVSIATGDATVE